MTLLVIKRSNGQYYRGQQYNVWTTNLAQASLFEQTQDSKIVMDHILEIENKFGEYPCYVSKVILEEVL